VTVTIVSSPFQEAQESVLFPSFHHDIQIKEHFKKCWVELSEFSFLWWGKYGKQKIYT
jgi:hypothetical protein